MLRLVIIIPVYAMAASLLPRWTALSSLWEALARVPQSTTVVATALALLVSVAGLVTLGRARRPDGQTQPAHAILHMGAIGLAFAAVYDLFEGLRGRAISAEALIIVPLAFMVSEAVYQILLYALRRRRKQSGRSEQHADHLRQDADDRRADGEGLRLLITIPIYVFVIIFLPDQPNFHQWTAPLREYDPALVGWISIVALALAALGPILIRRHVSPAEAQGRGLQLLFVVLASFGLGFAAILNIVFWLTGYAPELTNLIVIPIGIVLAELVYIAVRWRMRRGPLEL